jgi:hypothetical protein
MKQLFSITRFSIKGKELPYFNKSILSVPTLTSFISSSQSPIITATGCLYVIGNLLFSELRKALPFSLAYLLFKL